MSSPIQSLNVDLGLLLISNNFNIQNSGSELEHQIRVQSALAFQALLEKISQLPTQSIDYVDLVKLPPPVIVLPRAKPIPAAKSLTRWEQFARDRGIQKRKKSRMIWDEAAREWRPNWGYNRAGSESRPENAWLIEHPDRAQSEDIHGDPFAKAREAKRERVAKNEVQRLRNIKRAMGAGSAPTPSQSGTPGIANGEAALDSRNRTLVVTKRSTASLGHFDPHSRKEKHLEKDTRIGVPKGQKRKFDSVTGDVRSEHEKQLRVLDRLLASSGGSTSLSSGGGRAVTLEEVALDKAANRSIGRAQFAKHEEREREGRPKPKRAKGPHASSHTANKNSDGKGRGRGRGPQGANKRGGKGQHSHAAKGKRGAKRAR